MGLPIAAATVSISRDERCGTREVAHPRACYAQLGKVERQLRERAGVADELNLPDGDRVHALEVPNERACDRGHPAPPQDVLHGDIDERLRCGLQHRSGDGVSLGGQQREAVEQEVEGTRTTPRRREGLDGAADLQQYAAFGEMPRHTGCTPRGQVSLAREIRVEWLETSRGLEQQPRSILPETRGESDVAAQHRNREHAGTRRAARPRPWPPIRAPRRTRRPGSSPARRLTRDRPASPGRA